MKSRAPTMISLAKAAELANQRRLLGHEQFGVGDDALDLVSFLISSRIAVFGRKENAPRVEQITRAQLGQGYFQDGATRFVMEDGSELVDLSVRERDLTATL